MKVARSPGELGRKSRAVAIGTFDGVHLGHQAVIRAAADAGSTPTVVTFHPHPRTAFGNRVALLATLERRLELLAEQGIEETLVVEFTPELASGTIQGEAVLTQLQAEDLAGGRWYFNVHTAANPGGEIRGQVGVGR